MCMHFSRYKYFCCCCCHNSIRFAISAVLVQERPHISTLRNSRPKIAAVFTTLCVSVFFVAYTHFELNKIKLQLFHVYQRDNLYLSFLCYCFSMLIKKILSLIASSNYYYLYHRNFQLIVVVVAFLSSFNRKNRRNNNLVPPT